MAPSYVLYSRIVPELNESCFTHFLRLHPFADMSVMLTGSIVNKIILPLMIPVNKL
jgi:hypothetical protein